MPPVMICRSRSWLALLILPALVGAQDLAPVWELGAQGSFAEAIAALPEDPKGEEAVFTRAMLSFNRQPRSAGNLTTAADLLAGLAREGTTAELRARSLYFQARAETLLQPDGSQAAALYERLWRDYPDESYGQRGVVHLLLMAFYGPGDEDTVLAAVAGFEIQAERLTDPVVRSQFHQVAARGYLHLGGQDERALEHLLQVAALGVARREALGDLHVSIGQLAGDMDLPDLAREHYTRFLHDYPHDPRAYTVKALLAALPAN